MTTLESLQKAAPTLAETATSGGFSTSLLPASNADAARAALIKWMEENGGSGWLRCLDLPETRRINSAQDIAGTAIPYCGEFVSQDGHSSLHLRFEDGIYHLHHDTENPEADGMVLEEERLASSQLGSSPVCYRVSWSLIPINGFEELRPVAARFTGFESSK